jgi:hypothetical protein
MAQMMRSLFLTAIALSCGLGLFSPGEVFGFHKGVGWARAGVSPGYGGGLYYAPGAYYGVGGYYAPGAYYAGVGYYAPGAYYYAPGAYYAPGGYYAPGAVGSCAAGAPGSGCAGGPPQDTTAINTALTNINTTLTTINTTLNTIDKRLQSIESAVKKIEGTRVEPKPEGTGSTKEPDMIDRLASQWTLANHRDLEAIIRSRTPPHPDERRPPVRAETFTKKGFARKE